MSSSGRVPSNADLPPDPSPFIPFHPPHPASLGPDVSTADRMSSKELAAKVKEQEKELRATQAALAKLTQENKELATRPTTADSNRVLTKMNRVEQEKEQVEKEKRELQRKLRDTEGE